MKRSCVTSHATGIGCAFTGAILAAMLFASIPARADISVRIDIGNAPPAPHIVFLAQPHERRYSGDPVYVVDDPRVGDIDCFHYQGYYWLFQDGYWYRSASWRGPFLVFDPHNVPTVFYQQPPTRWKHHPSGPPEFSNTSGGRSPAMARRNGMAAPQPMNRSGQPQMARQSGGSHPQAAQRDVVTPSAGQKNGGHGAVVAAKRGGPSGHAKMGGRASAEKPKTDAKGDEKGGNGGK